MSTNSIPSSIPFSSFCFLVSSFSANAHVRDKIRQQLQARSLPRPGRGDLGLLEFLAPGHYHLV
jgi:hypothetical protein